MLFETRAYDEALQQLSAPMPKDFAPLAADRSGDILLAQGKKTEAKAQYQSAYKGLDERSDYRRIIEIKLNALGVDPVVKTAAPAASSKEAGK
jgi:predicted negative regulator of RcsB-dependent stress response